MVTSARPKVSSRAACASVTACSNSTPLLRISRRWSSAAVVSRDERSRMASARLATTAPWQTMRVHVLFLYKKQHEREHRRRDDDADDQLTHRPLLEQHREPRQQQLAHRLDKVEPQGAQLVLTDPPLDPPAIAHALLDRPRHSHRGLHGASGAPPGSLGRLSARQPRTPQRPSPPFVAELLVAQCDDDCAGT